MTCCGECSSLLTQMIGYKDGRGCCYSFVFVRRVCETIMHDRGRQKHLSWHVHGSKGVIFNER